MELFSNKFKQTIQTLFDRPNLILIATIPIKPLAFVDKIRTRKDCHLMTVCFQIKQSSFDIRSFNLGYT
jgi:nucleoside-triphosphatase THEP1